MEYIIFFIFYVINVIFSLLEPVIFGKILDLIIENAGKIDFETQKNIVFLISILLVQYITINDNNTISDEKIIDILKQVGLYDKIKSFENGIYEKETSIYI